MGRISMGSSGRPVTRFKIYGERNTGTNYAEQLIAQNFPDLRQHVWYPWEKHQFVHVPFVLPGTMAVVIVRNAHDWFKSMYRNPHQIAGWVFRVNFDEFLRHEWACRTNGMILNVPPRKTGLTLNDELMFDRHPVTGKRIENIVTLRSLKLKSYLKVPEIFPDYVVVQYEMLRDNPKSFIEALASEFQLAMSAFVEVTRDVSRDGVGKNAILAERRKQTHSYSEDGTEFIRQTLDFDAEASVGYRYDDKFDLIT